VEGSRQRDHFAKADKKDAAVCKRDSANEMHDSDNEIADHQDGRHMNEWL